MSRWLCCLGSEAAPLSRARSCLPDFPANDPDTFCAAEEALMADLSVGVKRLVTVGGLLDTKSEAGSKACSTFLQSLTSACDTLCVPKQSRSYRSTFSANYRALLSGEGRLLRVDILDASLDYNSVIWVNGDKFEFGQHTQTRVDALQQQWHSVCHLFDRSLPWPGRFETMQALEKLDKAWADFENRYISELIDIEDRAKEMIVVAVMAESKLTSLETAAKGGPELRNTVGKLQSDAEYCDAQKHLVDTMNKINSVANTRRKGRQDLTSDILAHAFAVLEDPEGTACSSHAQADARQAAVVLAADVVDAFESFRVYLRKVGKSLDHVNPHLCRNSELVARLADWEESWEVGARYVQQPTLLQAVCDAVAELRGLQRSVPEFQVMCDDCDVELFLILPRVVLMCFLFSPIDGADLLRTLLPKRFSGEGAEASVCPELQAFVGKFEVTTRLLREGFPGDDEQLRAWCFRTAAKGCSESCDFPAALAGREDLTSSLAGLLHELERWSMELQRHCPDDWNQCTATLLQCLEGAPKPR